MKKFNKKGIIKIILILIACFTIFSQYYLEHYVTDAYKATYLGTSYLTQLKLIEGRPIQSLYFFILNKIGINFSFYSHNFMLNWCFGKWLYFKNFSKTLQNSTIFVKIERLMHFKNQKNRWFFIKPS